MAVERSSPEHSQNVTFILRSITEGKDVFYLPNIQDVDDTPLVLAGGTLAFIEDEEVELNPDETLELGEALGRTHTDEPIH